MNHGPVAAADFFNKFNSELSCAESVQKVVACGDVEIAFFVPAVSLLTAVEATRGLSLIIGAENMHWEKSGAFTGETSGTMITDIGATHVLVGHSERRHIFRETDEELNKKVHSAIECGLITVLCVGETVEERESGRTFDVIKRQFTEGLKGIEGKTLADKIIIAYEPVWAIGTGKTASNSDAEEVCDFIRSLAKETYSEKIANELIILYGGSVNADNTSGIISQPDIDGLLVGGASLKPDSFMQIVKNAL